MIRLPSLPRIPHAMIWALLGALASGLVVSQCHHPVSDPLLVTVTDTVRDSTRWVARRDSMREQLADTVGVLTGLRRRLADVETRRPKTVTVYAGHVDLDTMRATLVSHIDPHGQLVQDIVLPTGDSAGTHRGAVTGPVYVGDCDRGLTLAPGVTECHGAPAGHLTIYLGAGVETADTLWRYGLPPPVQPRATLRAQWTPSYRSLWQVELGAGTAGRGWLEVRRGWRPF